MRVVELVYDGWTRKSIGAKGVLLRRNPEHIERCIRAIRQRYENEVEITICKAKAKVIPLKRKV